MIVIPVKTGIQVFSWVLDFRLPAGRQVLTLAPRSAQARRHGNDSPKHFLNSRVEFLTWSRMIKHGRGAL